MEKEVKNTSIPHKYNVGDEITVKIAKVESVGSKPAYRIKGIENIKISEAAIEKMSQKKIKTGDIVYDVATDDDAEIVWFDAAVIEDVGTEEIKVYGEWSDIESSGRFFDEKLAEEYAVMLAQKHGYKIVKGGLFGQRV